jgi:predicted PurR-regulated permease PerM
MIKVTPLQKRWLAVATAIALFGGFYFLSGYFMLIVFAGIVAFMFNPLYQRLLRKGRKPRSAAAITLVVSILTIIIPLTLLIVLSVYQVAQIAESVKHASSNFNLNQLLQNVVNYCNHFFENLGISYRMSVANVTNALSEALKSFASGMVNSLKSSLSSFISFFTIAIIYIYVFLSLLVKQDNLIELFHQLNPLGREVSLLYRDRVSAMTKAMVRGQFIIATTQGFTDALLLYLAGFHTGFVFYFLILTALSIIPLGGGIIVIPIGIIMLLTGNIWQGVLILAGHFLIVTNEDNIMRPNLVPKQARLDPALTLLAVFSGLHFFGFLGIIIGPVIMILIVTTIQVYMEVYKEIESVDRNKYEKQKRRILRKLKFWQKKQA